MAQPHTFDFHSFGPQPVLSQYPTSGLPAQSFPVHYDYPQQFSVGVAPGLLEGVPQPLVLGGAAPYESTEEKLEKLKKTLSGALEVIQERTKFKPREVVLRTQKTKSEKILVGYTPYGAQTFVSQEVPDYKEVVKTVNQPVQRPDGTVEQQKVTVKTLEPQFVTVGKVHIERIPQGQDVTEYLAEEDTELSTSLFEALKHHASEMHEESSDIKKHFETATSAVWGPYPEDLKPSVSLYNGNPGTDSASKFSITAKPK